MKKLFFLCLFFSSFFRLYAQTCQNCGVNQATPQSSLHVTGCGSTNATSAFQVTNSTGNSMFFVQDDQKVGIGTKNLTYKLELSDTNSASGVLDMFRMYNRYSATNNNGAQLLFSANRTTSGQTNVAGISGLITDISSGAYKGALTFSTASNASPAERMRINDVGNVGIGTTNPSAKLQITATGAGAQLLRLETERPWVFEQGSTGSTTELILESQNSNKNFIIKESTTAYRAAQFHVSSTATTNAVYLVPDGGNVGIGTASPLEQLHITGNFVVGGNIFGKRTGNTNLSIGVKNYSNDGAAMTMYPDDHPTRAGEIAFVTGNGGSTSKFKFLHYDGSTWLTQMIIASDGKVGIGAGSATPTVQLDVSYDDAVTNGLTAVSRITHSTTGTAANGIGTVMQFQAENSIGGFSVGADIGTVLTDVTSGSIDADFIVRTVANSTISEKFRVTNIGNVGIGTYNPAAKLEVYETTGLGGTTGDYQIFTRLAGYGGTSNKIMNNYWLKRKSTGTTWTTAVIHNGISVDASFLTPGVDTKTWWERDPNSNIQSWGNASSTYMTINAGNVGIGTTSPSSKLTVVDETNAGVNFSQYNSSEGVNIRTYAASGTIASPTQKTSGQRITSLTGFGYTSSGAFSPAAASIGFYASENFTSSANGSHMIFSTTTNGSTSSAERMRIDNAGNIGIGTASPIFKLHVNGGGTYGQIASFQNSTYETFFVTKASGASVYNPLVAANDNGIFWKDDGTVESSNGFVIAPWSNSSNGVRIDGNGNVGIGTGSPTSILHTVASGAKTGSYTGNYLSNTASLSSPMYSGTKIGLDVQSTGSWTGGGAGSANVGLNVNATGGDFNYAAIFQGGGVGIGTTTPNTLLDIEGAISTRPSTTVNITADNQVVTVGNRSYLRLSSDNATGANRTVVLTPGLQQGQILSVEFTGTNQAELLDDGALNGGGNQRMSGALTLTQYDVISFIWNGTDWIETTRSAN